MLTQLEPNQSPKGAKVNWVKEWIIGAFISAGLTVAAAHAGNAGVISKSLAARIHDVVIIGGTTVAMICGYAALVAFFGGILDSIKDKTSSSLPGSRAHVHRSFGSFPAAKFMKIFLP